MCAFHLYSSTNLEELARIFHKEVYSNRKGISLEPEIVINQTRCVSDWMRLELTKMGNGLAMNLEMLLPAEFTHRALNILYPQSKENPRQLLNSSDLRWEIFRHFLKEGHRYRQELYSFLPQLTQGQEHPAESEELIRCWQLSGKCADLLDRYQLVWPQLIQQWRELSNDDVEALTPPQMRWMARLYRQCLLGTGKESYERLMQQFIHTPHKATLPWRRFSIFGAGAMHESWMRFFMALGENCDCQVYFFHLVPCDEFWGDAKDRRRRSDEEESGLFINPVLENNCRQGQALYNFLIDQGYAGGNDAPELTSLPDGASRLHTLQYDIRNRINRTAGNEEMDAAPQAFDRQDTSVMVHCCHNNRRQLEVLRDQLMHALASDPTLHPSDIMIMSPDISSFVPYIPELFDCPPFQDKYTIRDRTPLSSSPLLAIWMKLLHCFTGKFKGEDILQILENPVVAARFRLSHNDLKRLREWVKNSGIRWGADAEHHQQHRGMAFPEFSWEYGLKRLMTGFCRSTAEDTLDDDGIAGYDYSTEDWEALAKLSSFIHTMLDLRQKFIQPHTVEEWQPILLQSAEKLLFVKNSEIYTPEEVEAIRRCIDSLARHGQQSQIDQPVPLRLLALMLEETLSAPPSRQNFLGDKMLFCSMQPMRSIPRRIIAILGMDENSFSRQQEKLSFDLRFLKLDGELSRQYGKPLDCWTPMDEYRFMFLEALMAAQDKLWFFYNGVEASKNSEQQPAIPLGELVEYLRTADANGEFQVLQHSMHPSNPQYFQIEQQKNPAFVSYNQEAYDICKIVQSPSKSPKEQEEQSEGIAYQYDLNDLEQPPTQKVSLKELQDFFAEPCRGYLKSACSLDYPEYDDDEEVADLEITEKLQPLENYSVYAALEGWIKNHNGQDMNWEEFQRLLQAKCMLAPPPEGDNQIEMLQEFYNSLEKNVDDHDFSWNELIANATPTPFEARVYCDNTEYTINATLQYGKINDTAYVLLPFYSSMKWKHLVKIAITNSFISECFSDEEKPRLFAFTLESKQLKPAKDYLNACASLVDVITRYYQGLQEAMPLFSKPAFKYADYLCKGTEITEKQEDAIVNEYRSSDYAVKEKRAGGTCKDPAILRCGFDEYALRSQDGIDGDYWEPFKKLVEEICGYLVE